MSGATYDTATVRWSGGEVSVGTPAVSDSLEAFLEETSITTEAQASEYGTLWLANHGTTVDQVSVGISPDSTAVTPFVGLNKGDAVQVANRAGTLENDRIHSIGFTGIARNGVPKWAVTVGTRRQEAIISDERTLAKLGGNMGGSFAAGVSSPAPSFGDAVSGQLPVITLPVADADAFTTTAPYDRTAPYRFGESTSIIRLACQADSLVGTTDSIVGLYRVTYSGSAPTAATLMHSFTWPHAKYLYQSFCDVTYSPDQGYQLRVLQAGAHNLVAIQPFGSSAN